MTSSQSSVLITGASAGSIGSALALAFANRGFLTFATARDPSKIERSLSNLGNVHQLQLDVTSQESIHAAYNLVASKTNGRLDHLVNNTGAGYTTPLVDFDEMKGRAVFDVNFRGLLSVTKAFMPLVAKVKGTVVNISSVGATVHTPWIGKSVPLPMFRRRTLASDHDLDINVHHHDEIRQ
jgi:1-acylglycerone phosphate reductase